MTKHFLDLDAFSEEAIRQLLARSHELHKQGKAKPPGKRFSLGLLFIEDSLRTRFGFAEAAARLGGVSFDITHYRDGAAMSSSESFEDTISVLTRTVDAVVIRMPETVDRDLLARIARAPVINGGDGGGHHPGQGLIDLFAAERHAGGIEGKRVAFCGDMTSRAARTSVRAFARLGAGCLRLISPKTRQLPEAELQLLRQLTEVEVTTEADFAGIDILHMSGLAPGTGPDALPEAERMRFALTTNSSVSLPREAVILSPMPVIDEIDATMKQDPRCRIYEQAGDGIAVRMAILEHVLDLHTDPMTEKEGG